jgi:hypothetical protein
MGYFFDPPQSLPFHVLHIVSNCTDSRPAREQGERRLMKDMTSFAEQGAMTDMMKRHCRHSFIRIIERRLK